MGRILRSISIVRRRWDQLPCELHESKMRVLFIVQAVNTNEVGICNGIGCFTHEETSE